MSDIHHFYKRETVEEEARGWLIKLDGDSPLSEDYQKALQAWCQRSPAHREELLRIAKFFEEANLLVNLAVPLKSHASNKKKKVKWPGLKLLGMPGAAGASYAAVLLVVFVVLFKLYQLDSITELNGVYASAIGEIQQHTLADGSVVYLNTNSQIDIDYNSAVRKIRLLKGEAHFSVAKDNEWPFEVYVGEKMVKAVGTAFTIKIAGQGVSVAVTEGRVDLVNMIEKSVASLKAAPEGGEVKARKIGSLGRGQQAVISTRPANESAVNTTGGVIITTISDQQMERKTSWQTGYLLFAGEPLSDVVAEISRYTNTQIEIVSPELRALRIGGRFKIDDLRALFNVLETNMGITVSRLDDTHIQLSAAIQ